MELDGNEGDLGWRELLMSGVPAFWLGRLLLVITLVRVPWVVAGLFLLLSVLGFPGVGGMAVISAIAAPVLGSSSASEKCKSE